MLEKEKRSKIKLQDEFTKNSPWKRTEQRGGVENGARGMRETFERLNFSIRR